MTDRNMTLAEARRQLRAVGVKIEATIHGEYRVTFTGLSKSREEAVACYATDLADAVATGLAMAKKGNK